MVTPPPPPRGGRGRKLQAPLHELREVGGELGSGHDEAPEGVQVIAAQGAVAHRVGAARVAIIHQHPEAVAEHRQRSPQPDAVAGAHGLPGAPDARLERGALLAVLSGLDAARRDRARSGRGEKYLPLLTLAVLKSEPHTVTEGPRGERVGPGR